jgi:hypothetical protein
MVEVIRDMNDDEAYSVKVDGEDIKLAARKGTETTLTPDEASKVVTAAKWETEINLGDGRVAEPANKARWDFDFRIVLESGSHIVSASSDVLEEAIEAAEQTERERLIEKLRDIRGVTKVTKGSQGAIAVTSSRSHNRDVSALMYANEYVMLDASGLSGDEDHYLYFTPVGASDMNRELRERGLTQA